MLNNSGYLSERLLCTDMALAYNDIAVWNYAELPHALGCQGWFNARVNSCGVLADALKTAEQTGGAAYIEVITDAYEAPPMCRKLHENVKSFNNIHWVSVWRRYGVQLKRSARSRADNRSDNGPF